LNINAPSTCASARKLATHEAPIEKVPTWTGLHFFALPPKSDSQKFHSIAVPDGFMKELVKQHRNLTSFANA
jgi:hypothetical protein